jgi:pteridine reductase
MVYTAAKGGLLALTRSLALELGPKVRVNGVSPGAIMWPDGPEWQNEGERQRIIDHTLLKRIGEPEDIAGAVEFLATAPYVTGQIIAIDGGRSIML